MTADGLQEGIGKLPTPVLREPQPGRGGTGLPSTRSLCGRGDTFLALIHFSWMRKTDPLISGELLTNS